MLKKISTFLMIAVMAISFAMPTFSTILSTKAEVTANVSAINISVDTGNGVVKFSVDYIATNDGFTTADLVATWNGKANSTSTITHSGNIGDVTYGDWLVNPTTTGKVHVSIKQVMCKEQSVVFTLTDPKKAKFEVVIPVPALHNYSWTGVRIPTCANATCFAL